jgi:transcriptional regulator with XRE-family HTH domain
MGACPRSARTSDDYEKLKASRRAGYRALGFERQANVSLLERSKALPKPETVRKMASAIGVEPSALLDGVVTPYDRLRDGRAPETRSAGISPHQAASSERAIDARLLDALSEPGSVEDAIAVLSLPAKWRQWVAQLPALLDGATVAPCTGAPKRRRSPATRTKSE